MPVVGKPAVKFLVRLVDAFVYFVIKKVFDVPVAEQVFAGLSRRVYDSGGALGFDVAAGKRPSCGKANKGGPT